MADTVTDESGHDEARPLSDEGEPGRGSLTTETVAGTVGGAVAGSLVGWGTAGIAEFYAGAVPADLRSPSSPPRQFRRAAS